MKTAKIKIKSIVLMFMALTYINHIKAQVTTVNFLTDSVITINTQTMVSVSNRIPIDLNNDNQIDYTFRYDVFFIQNVINEFFIHMVPIDYPLDTNKVSCIASVNTFSAPYAKMHDAFDQIGPSLLWKTYDINNQPEPMLSDNQLANFSGQGLKYVGVKFKSGVQWRYGYIKLMITNINPTTKEVRVKGYAFEQSGNPITIPCSLPSAPISNTPLNFLNICNNLSTTLTVLSASNPTVNWYSSPTSTISIGSGTSLITPTLSPGTYTYYAAAFSCTNSNLTAITVTVNNCNATDINESSKNNLMFKAFPNPFTDELIIEVNEPSQITITNALGEVVRSVDASNSIKIDTQDLPKAIYILCVKTQYGLKIKKLIKE